MTDLTDKLKKGKLPCGWYYLKVNKELANHPVIAECVVDYGLMSQFSYFYDFDEAKIKQVLAPVPSYDEWEKLNWYAGNGVEENQELKMEKAELKELLESALSWLPDSSKFRAGRYAQLQNLKRKIKEVLK